MDLLCLPEQIPDQLISNHCPADLLIRIWTILLLRINYDGCRRQPVNPFPLLLLIGNLMVISHNNRHSTGIRKTDLIGCRNPIVTGEYRINAILLRLFNQMIIQSISILHPVWNHGIHICTKKPQAPQQNIRGTHTVHIVIPDDTDFHPLSDLLKQTLTGLLHSF